MNDNKELLETGEEIIYLINELTKNVNLFYKLQSNLKAYERTNTADILNTFSCVSSLYNLLPCQVNTLRNKLNNLNVIDEIHHCNQLGE